MKATITYKGSIYAAQRKQAEIPSVFRVSHKLNVMVKRVLDGNEDVEVEEALREACDDAFSMQDMSQKECIEFGVTLGRQAGDKKIWLTQVADQISLLWIGSENQVSERIWQAAHEANKGSTRKPTEGPAK